MKEVWKDILEYKGIYQVSNSGKVRNVKTGKELKPYILPSGYVQVCLCNNGYRRKEYIHRLVAIAFIPNPDGKSTVNHINEIKTDNRVENLEWATQKENNAWGTARKRSAEARGRKCLCVETGNIYPSTAQAARETGLYQANIHRCCLNENGTTGGYHWRFVQEV